MRTCRFVENVSDPVGASPSTTGRTRRRLGKHRYLVFEDAEFPASESPESEFRMLDRDFFVMGDNRNNSSDSRSYNDGRRGGVKMEAVIGPVWLTWMSFARHGRVLWERVLHKTTAAPGLAPCAAPALGVRALSQTKAQRRRRGSTLSGPLTRARRIGRVAGKAMATTSRGVRVVATGLLAASPQVSLCRWGRFGPDWNGTNMKFRELRSFARTADGGRICPTAARALALPMPDDVLEQFILDHGLNPDFQEPYAELNLNRVTWSQERLSIEQIAGCSSKFDTYVVETEEKYASIRSLNETPLSPEAIASWMKTGTWVRAPIFLVDVLPPPDERHLVEGHTRVGALLGLNQNPHLAVASSYHACWVGRPAHKSPIRDWRAVRREHPLPFGDWIYDAIGQDDTRGRVAMALIDARARHRYDLPVGKNLADLVRLAECDRSSGVDAGTLAALHKRWQSELEL